MDSSGPTDDEVIADSEGEMDEEELQGNQGILSENVNTVSQVSAFTLTSQLHAKTTSSISAFTTGSPAFWKQTTIADNTGNQTIRFSDVDNFVGTASIADRAKTRQRNSKSSSIQSSSTRHNSTASGNNRLEKQKSKANLTSDIIELSSDEDDDELSLRPSKPKPKARPKPKLKVKDKPRDTSSNKTPHVSGTAEISIGKSADAIPDSRPRPRPRPLVKRSKPVHESTVPPPLLSLDAPGLLPSSSASASHGPELPIATSPVRPHLQTSPLPPSDPPLSTLTTIHNEDLPRIETLPNVDFDGPLSSPSSLFSDLDDTAKKRKRTILDLDIDELASDGNLGSGQGGFGAVARYDYDNGVAAPVPPHMLPPPPTFFAGSSSSSVGGGGRMMPPQNPSETGPEVVDLTMLPSTIEPTSAAAIKKTAKAKNWTQSKGDAGVLEEDELDSDFDPMESTKKGKAKPKPKPKAKKGAKTKAKQGEGWGHVEGSILPKPRTPKTKGKGKQKATAGKQDTFKSREFIDDSDDDEDAIQLIPSVKDPATSDTNHSTSTNGKAVHISTSTASNTAEISVTASVGATSGLEENTVVSPGDNFEKSTPSSSSNRMNNKRKSIIESDLENEDEGEKRPTAAGTSSKKHKGKQGKNGSNVDEEAHSTIHVNPPAATKKGKGKNVVWSDEDDEDSVMEVDRLDPSAGLSKGKKPASRIDDEGGRTKKGKAKGKKSKTISNKAVEDASRDDNDAHMEDHEEQQHVQEAEVAKENVIPPAVKSTAKTSEPDDRPNAESPGLFPTLHSRYEIAPRRSSLPMSELIRRANSMPGSPFATPHPRTSSTPTARPTKSGITVTAYSPYMKSSRSFLSRIAPLHPNRRTPPPPPPPPPPKKKTKKELEMEEKWEEEMIDSVGISEWTCLADDEKKELRRAKWAREMGDWDD